MPWEYSKGRPRIFTVVPAFAGTTVRAWRRQRPVRERPYDYFQPDSLSQALRSATWVFSHWVMDWVSLLSILLFMQVQYFRITASAASPLLSLTQALIHLTSSVVAAKAVLLATNDAAITRATAIFIRRLRKDKGLVRSVGGKRLDRR